VNDGMLETIKTGLLSLGERATQAAAPRMLPPSFIARRGPRHKRRVALTFDDGPDELSLAYLDVLAKYRVHATFFVVGAACVSRRELLRAMVERGHELGNHGFSHTRFTTLRKSELDDELERTLRLLPKPTPKLVRPPHGALSVSSLMTCAAAGYRTILWSKDSMDAHTDSMTGVVAATFSRRIEAGEIILLHEGQKWTLGALPIIIERLLESRYELVTVGEMLDG
jgi:peptidoglycan/xylan/chitin deacetylase (PgdA/CDA1 family)